MSLAQLGETESDVQRSATVAFLKSVAPGSLIVRRELVERETFTSRHTEVYEKTLGKGVFEQYEFSRDNPHLAAGENDHLDVNGMIAAGRRVKAGEVLWSCTYADKPGMKPRDESQRVPPLWEGATVVESDWSEQKKQVAVRVRLECHHDLAPGDLLVVGAHSLGVVSEIVDEEDAADLPAEADIFASQDAGERLDCRGACATLDVGKHLDVPAFHAVSRRGGPYSLITQQPLRRPPLAPPQLITVAHLRWLLERGCSALAKEFVGLKCDEVESRSALKEFAGGNIGRDALPAAGTPLSLKLITAELMGMGFTVEINDEPELRIRPSTREEVLARSSGHVIKPETINYRTYEGEPDGLFCPNIFQEHPDRFGHIELCSPIVPIWWRQGSPSLLERLLPFPGEQIGEVINSELHLQVVDGEAVFKGSEALGDGSWQSSGEAIKTLLAEFGSSDLPPGLENGLEVLTPDVLPVLPEPFRPLVLLDSGNFATSDLNDLYRRVINRNNRLRKLIELKAPPVILKNEQRMLQLSVDGLYANQLTPRPVLGTNNRPLKSISEICMQRLATDTVKRVTWSAQARAVIDQSLPSQAIVVPRPIYEKLQLTADVPVLLTSEEGAAFVALTPRAGEDLVFRISAQAAHDLEYPMDGEAFFSLHAPLRTTAVGEAQRLLQGEFETRPLPESRSWLEPDDERQALQAIIEAACTFQPARLDTPHTMLFAGQ